MTPGRNSAIAMAGSVNAIVLLAFAKFAIQFATANRYGIFSDELYNLACARHLAAGYVDQPPLIALLVWVSVHLFGTSLLGLRSFRLWLAGSSSGSRRRSRVNLGVAGSPKASPPSPSYQSPST